MSVNAEAHRIAIKIEAEVGASRMTEGHPVAGNVKTMLRNFYVATGGKRGAGGYEPSAREFRRLYNGEVSGAALLKSAGGGITMADEVAPTDLVTETGPEEQAVAAIRALLGGQKVEPEAVKKIAVDAVNGRIGEVLTSMAGLIADEVAKQVRTVEVKVAEMPKVKIDSAHMAFEDVLLEAAQRRGENGIKEGILLVGPAGSGKTTLAEQIANALSLPFYGCGKTSDEVKITGYMDGGGTYRTTSFRKAYEFGGVFLFDEMDGWSADALIAVNAPLAGRWGDFPDGMVKRHPDFIALGAANTFGRGADRQYVGREQLDAATLDRFAIIEVDYDEDLELAISCNAEWTKYVQKVRKAVMAEKVRHVVSPRASIAGGVMLAAGKGRTAVEEAYLWKGIEEPVRNRVKAAMR
jgi:hypothetical protein